MATPAAEGVPESPTGPGVEKPESGMAAAARPAVAATEVKRRDRQPRSPEQFLSLFFRLLQLCAAVISFVILLVCRQGDLGFRSYQAFKYVFSATVIAAAWALLMLLIELVQLCLGRKIRSLLWRTVVCVGDWLMAILAFSAGCAGAAVTTFNDRGVVLLNYAPCMGSSPYNHIFCARTKAAVAFSFIAFGFFIPHLFLSTLSLLVRMYEG